jgi:hypothetical protein
LLVEGSDGIRNTGGDMINTQSPELCKDSGAYEARKKESLRARYVYGLIFFATNLLAWFIRDYGAKVFNGLHRRFLTLSISRFLHLQLEGPCHELQIATF